MHLKRNLCLGLMLGGMAALVLGLATSPVQAADWKPNRPVTFIVPAGEGGGADLPARTLAKAAESLTRIKFVVENIPGGAGQAGIAEWLKRPRDGHTIFLSTCEHTAFIGQDILFKLEDVAPVLMLQRGPATLLARTGNPDFTTFDEFIAYARKGNKIQAAVFRTPFSFDDFMIRAIASKYGITINQVPYSGATERYSALLGAHVDVLSQRAGDVTALIQGGKMTPLLINDANVSKGLGLEVPTFKDKGMDFDLSYWRGVWMAAGNPPEALAFYQDLLTRAMQTKEWKAFEEKTTYRDGYMSAADMADYMKKEVAFVRSVAGSK